MSKITYEIWDSTTQELLVDGLARTQAIEQLAIYQEYFGDGVTIAMREHHIAPNHHTTDAQAYKQAFVDYFAQLQAMGNIN